MIGIGKIQIPTAVRFLQQDLDNLLPHPTPLVFKQAPMAGFGGGHDVMGEVFPLATGLEHVQDAIENLPLVGPGPSSPCPFWQQGLQIVPLDIRHIGPVRLP
jgi:hypothetical protein